MRIRGLVVGTVLAMATAATPALAEDAGGGPHGNAYGRYCQGQSKKHVQGMRGTPFSACVRAMAQLDRGKTTSPREACKDMSKRRVAGQRSTPFARCVQGGTELLDDKAEPQAGEHPQATGHGRPAT